MYAGRSCTNPYASSRGYTTTRSAPVGVPAMTTPAPFGPFPAFHLPSTASDPVSPYVFSKDASKVSPHFPYVGVSSPNGVPEIRRVRIRSRDRESSCPRTKRRSITIEVVETALPPDVEEPTYYLRVNLNGRSYLAARPHRKLRAMIESLSNKGYRIPWPFPEVEDVLSATPVKALGESQFVDSIPFYENFGYSIKSLASTVVRRSNALRGARRSFQVEQLCQRLESFLSTILVENEDLHFEQVVYQFLWEPLEKKLAPLLEVEMEDEEERDGEQPEERRETSFEEDVVGQAC